MRSLPAENAPVPEGASQTIATQRSRHKTITALGATSANTSPAEVTVSVMASNIRVRPSTDFVQHLNEVSVRLEAAAGIAASALLGQVDRERALEAVIGMLEVSTRHLRAAVGQ